MINFLKRILTATVFVPIILLAFWLGGWYLISVLLLVVLAASYELKEMFSHQGIHLPIVSVILNCLVFYSATLGSVPLVFFSFVLSFFIILGVDLFANRIKGSVARVSAFSFMMTYVALFTASIYRIRALPTDTYMQVERTGIVLNGQILLVALILLVWVTDTAAYIFGMLLGKHRGIFSASPKKSLEGFVAGVVFAFIAALSFARFLPQYTNYPHMIIAAISAGIFGQIGDLFESVVKRDLKVKDSSQLLPGHGGVLDRFDNLLISAPIYYLLLQLFG